MTHPLWRPYVPVNAERQHQRVARRQAEPEPLEEHRPEWAAHYDVVQGLVWAAIADQVISLRHVGSTAVPSLIAKPVIDVDLVLPSVADESLYLSRLEAKGFRLIFRDDIAGDAHRQLTLQAPNANLHVWDPSAIEPRRHLLFVEHLRSSEDDRRRYAAAKRTAAAAPSGSYNDLKAGAVYDIYERAFRADPAHDHEPRPRDAAAAG